jgi:hypothetical protein
MQRRGNFTVRLREYREMWWAMFMVGSVQDEAIQRGSPNGLLFGAPREDMMEA